MIKGISSSKIFETTNVSTFFRQKNFIKSVLITLLINILLFPKILNKIKDSLLFSFYKSNDEPIKVAFYCYCMRYGGLERATSILLNYFSKEKYFTFYLITILGILNDEYEIPKNIERISLYNQKNKLFEIIDKNHIDILIYNSANKEEIEKLNKLNKTKVIYCIHSSYFYSIYNYHIYNFEQSLYNSYKNCKYVVSLITLENDYLFKIWGINSVLIENPSTFEYEFVIPSDLSQKNIIMIGRGDFLPKRFDFGIKAMKSIVKEFSECKMIILSPFCENLKNIITNLNLENNVKIIGFHKNPEPYLRNSSLNIFPSLIEAFPMALGEVKIFGIPSILCGLDYITLAKGGTVIIYDDNPDTIAKEAIKILRDDIYRKKLGKEARTSMEKINNKLIIKKWVKLLINVYNGIEKSSYANLFTDNYERITKKEVDIILNNQLNLLKKRVPFLSKVTLKNLKSYTLI